MSDIGKKVIRRLEQFTETLERGENVGASFKCRPMTNEEREQIIERFDLPHKDDSDEGYG